MRIYSLCLYLPLASALAWDPGWAPTTAKGLRLEIVGENYKRDIEQETRTSAETFVSRQREDRLWLRLSMNRGDWTYSAQAGRVEAHAALDPVPGVGAGIEKSLLGDQDGGLALFAGMTYVHDIQYRNIGGQVGSFVIADDTRSESHIEAGGGLRWKWRVPLGGDFSLHPYGGLIITFIRGDGSESFAFPDGVPVRGPRRGDDVDVDFEEDGIFGAVMGCGLAMPGNFALRLETRLVDRSTLSVGLSRSF